MRTQPHARARAHGHAKRNATRHPAISTRTRPPVPLQRIAGVTDPGSCLFMDDSVKNIRTANREGWRTVLVGLVGRDDGQPIVCEEADAAIASIHDLPSVLYTEEAP